MQIYTEPTTYTVSALPREHPERRHYEITVEYRGPDAWAVLHKRWCLNADGDWTFEPRSPERTAAWLALHRFDLDDALKLAQEHAPDLDVNGITARQALERRPT